MIYKLKLEKWHTFNFKMTEGVGVFSTLKFDIFFIWFTDLDLIIQNDETTDLLFHKRRRGVTFQRWNLTPNLMMYFSYQDFKD